MYSWAFEPLAAQLGPLFKSTYSLLKVVCVCVCVCACVRVCVHVCMCVCACVCVCVCVCMRACMCLCVCVWCTLLNSALQVCVECLEASAEQSRVESNSIVQGTVVAPSTPHPPPTTPSLLILHPSHPLHPPPITPSLLILPPITPSSSTTHHTLTPPHSSITAAVGL